MNTPNFLYKVATQQQWSDMQAKGMSYEQGSELDQKDGYLHLSTANQVERVALKYFPELKDGYLIQIDFEAVKEGIKWEPNSKGEDFPHAYEMIPSSAIIKANAFSSKSFDFNSLVF